MYDIVIIGSGPAGLSAAVYAKRAMLDVIVVEKEPISGGQMNYTDTVDNYLGLPRENGMELAMRFREHAEVLQVPFLEAEVIEVEPCGTCFKINLHNKEAIQSKTVVLAMGAKHRTLGVQGEERLLGSGVSYCATCDGAFFQQRDVAVIGGGDVALEEALYLSHICNQVHLIHRRDEFRGTKQLVDQVRQQENITMWMDSIVNEISGENSVEQLSMEHVVSHKNTMLSVDGVFIAVGTEPMNALVHGDLAHDSNGWVIANEDGKTNIPGIYVAGDLRKKPLRQIVTAVADGANVVHSIEEYLNQ